MSQPGVPRSLANDSFSLSENRQKEQLSTKGRPFRGMSEEEVFTEVANLFRGQEDLLSEFGQFLPEAKRSLVSTECPLLPEGHLLLSRDPVSQGSPEDQASLTCPLPTPPGTHWLPPEATQRADTHGPPVQAHVHILLGQVLLWRPACNRCPMGRCRWGRSKAAWGTGGTEGDEGLGSGGQACRPHPRPFPPCRGLRPTGLPLPHPFHFIFC